MDRRQGGDRVTRSVAVLGTGKMGAGMARNLRGAGLDVAVWNRTRSRAEPLAADGARVADTPADAAAGMDAIISMLWDGDSVAEVLAEALPAARGGVLWVQASTVSVEDAAGRLPALAAEHGAGFVDAPVLGTRQPAEQGTLVVLAAGPGSLRERAAPLFEAVGSRTLEVSDRPGDATRLKLTLNAWVLTLTAGTAQAVAAAQAFGLDPQLFLDAISGGALDSPYAHLKGTAMIAGDFPSAFGLDGALKDSELIVAAMRAAGTDPRVMEAIGQQFRAAAEAGHGAEDMAAVVHAFRR
ncbi:MAG TPA: NAD(P)-dependent oxidoreductase [Pseudonocardiaceae bacterium]|nr:NAD(P)-dependent oxidoreductase [Pseudonocardiaceae bacterium]